MESAEGEEEGWASDDASWEGGGEAATGVVSISLSAIVWRSSKRGRRQSACAVERSRESVCLRHLCCGKTRFEEGQAASSSTPGGEEGGSGLSPFCFDSSRTN